MAVIVKGQDAQCFRVVHPLDDDPEEKLSPEGLERMHMSLSVKISLMALRVYLIVMAVLVAYRLLELSGVMPVLH